MFILNIYYKSFQIFGGYKYCHKNMFGGKHEKNYGIT